MDLISIPEIYFSLFYSFTKQINCTIFSYGHIIYSTYNI